MYKKAWRWYQAVLALLDIVLINVSLFIAYWLRYEQQWFREVEEAHWVPFSAYLPTALLLTALLMMAYLWEGLYALHRGRAWLDEAYIIFRGTVTGIATMIIISLLYRPTLQSRLLFLYDAVIIVVLLSLSRLLAGHVMRVLRKRGIGVDRVLIVGAGEAGRSIMRSIVARPELGYQLVGFVDDAPEKANTDLGRIKAWGDTSQLDRVVQEQGVSEVIIALPWMSHHKMLDISERCQKLKVEAKVVPDTFQLSLSQVSVDELDGLPLLGVRQTSIRGWNLTVKRAMDIVGALLLIIVFAPLALIIALAIKLDSPGEVIFKQTRVGRNGVPFTCFKFRTMYEGAEKDRDALLPLNESNGPLFKMRNDPRRTRVGKFLRRSSLDELPNLINVLRGEMSLVGPRPALPCEVAAYQPWHRRRLEARPGMTGLAQVSGRSELTFEEIVLLDLYYIENWSLWLDLKILLRTLPAAISARGAF